MTPRPQFQNVSNHFVQDWEPPQAEDDRGRGFSLKLPGGYWQWQTWASVQVWMPGEGEEDFDIFDTTRNSSIINQSCLAAGNCTIVVNGNWAVWTSRLLECGVWSISRASLSGKSSKQSCNWPKVLGRRALQNPCPLFQACQVMSDISISMEWIGHGLSCFEMLVVLWCFVMFRDVLWNVSRYSYATIAPGPGAYDLLSCFGAQPRVPTARPRIHQHESVEIVAVCNSMWECFDILLILLSFSF